MMRFFHYTLRTTNVDAARAFYATVVGSHELDIVPLHEQALARGATPHWLGYLDVGEVDAAASAFVARGATPLAKWVNPQGLEAAVMRDPGGAIIALAKPAAAPIRAPADIAWHLLNTTDVAKAKANYGELFGWHFEDAVDLGSHGIFHPFAFEAGGPIVGMMSDLENRPGVHSHWLFHHRVASLDPAVEAVRAGGGLVIGPFTMPSGHRIAICDDPQGAAFALREERSPGA